MSTQITKPSAQPPAEKGLSLIRVAAAEYQMEPAAFAETIKKTIFPSGAATNEQLAAFIAVAHQYGLNPFLKEIYAFPGKGGGIMPIVSVDGWIKIINRHEQFESMSLQETIDEAGKPVFTTCTIRRKDRPEPTVITEHFAECKRNTEPWNQMPNRMLRHKAVIQCARYAFGFSGIQDEDEARDTVMREEASAKPAIPTVARKSVQAAPAQVIDVPAAAPENPDADPTPAKGLPLSFGDGQDF